MPFSSFPDAAVCHLIGDHRKRSTSAIYTVVWLGVLSDNTKVRNGAAVRR